MNDLLTTFENEALCNVILTFGGSLNFAFQGSKPWRFTGKEANMDREDIQFLVKKWWDIYNDESLDYKNTVDAGSEAENGGVAEQKQMSLQQFLAALKEAGNVRYVPAPSAA